VQTSILYFDQFELDLNSYELRKSGRAIKLEKMPMELLILLAQSQGQLVTREQIIQRLWGDNVFVDTRQGINTAMRKLRIALQDDSENPRLLQTVSGRGYRLLAVVSSPTAVGASAVEPSIAPPPPSSSEPALPVESAPADAVSEPKNRRHTMEIAGVLVVLLAIGGLVAWLYYRNQKNSASRKAWIEITNFSDSATQPALSPDGHMIAFIRGPETFVTPGEVYVKILPDGEPVQLTHDGLPKMAPAFSSDGSRIAYTATERSLGWNTWVVPVLGGEPKRLLPNAAALTWLDSEHVMFSEMNPGTAGTVTMDLVSAMESRAEERDIYLPPGGMAHRSWVSPDRKWVLVSEMENKKGWGPCRVIPFDGSTKGALVGPEPARCTYAGWSPDGATMYVSADAGDGYHVWRQAFPRGKPEQITFGPTEEEGITVAPDGRSLVTSAGIRESTVWVHDARGDRQISSEGFASIPGLGLGGEQDHSVFSPDGRKLYYLIRKQASRSWISGQLWVADLDSGRSESVLPGISISNNFSVSPDGKRVVFEATDVNGEPHSWIAPLDRSSPPKQITGSIARSPDFAAGGRIYFQARGGEDLFLYSVEVDGGPPQKVSEPLPRLMSLLGVSPHGEWRLSGISPAIAQPVGGGTPIRICNFCSAGWGPEGKYFYLRFRDIGEQGGGKTVGLRLAEGNDLPDLPPGGLKSAEDAKGLNVAAEIDMQGRSIFAPGPNPTIYAYTRVTVQRNLYRIPLD
jgi:Tol biopolymer transport system component/DNA-binding winged helix-turn-helix (wHTH) protein